MTPDARPAIGYNTGMATKKTKPKAKTKRKPRPQKDFAQTALGIVQQATGQQLAPARHK
ncbi:MAG: hypothetical protein AMXMBFR13_16070 [Phycisphaerae bacterium]